MRFSVVVSERPPLEKCTLYKKGIKNSANNKFLIYLIYKILSGSPDYKPNQENSTKINRDRRIVKWIFYC